MDDDAIERLLVDHPELEPHADVLRDYGQRAAHAGACRLAAALADQLNNLLTAILNHAALAGAELAPGSPAAQDVRRIEHAAKHAADLSVDLVTIAGQQMHRPGHVDIRCMASVVAGTLRERGDGATVEVTLAHPGVVVVDRGQVERALVILAGLGRGRARRVLLSAGPSGDDAARPSIRVDIAGSTPLALGRGSSDVAQHLALAVARGLVGRNGGRIVGPSTTPVGVCFDVLFAGPQSARTPADGAVSPRQSRILLAEDDDVVRDVLARVLRSGDYDVVTASDGVEALEATVGGPSFDLVITDLEMPRMGGLELAGRLRATQPLVPLLFISAYSTGLAAATTIAGASCLMKPFSSAELLARAREQLGAIRD